MVSIPTENPLAGLGSLDPTKSFSTSSLNGKSVIVTSGASGLGEEFARRFAASGCFVTIGDIDPDHGSQLAKELSHSQFAQCDVRDWNSQLAMFKAALEKSPSKSIDIVCANAGVNQPDGVTAVDPERDGPEPRKPDIKTFEINAVGVLYTIQLAMWYFTSLQKKEGKKDRCLILTDSMAGYGDIAGMLLYTSKKWAVRGMMRALRYTSCEEGIRVNTIAPFFVNTNIFPPQAKEFLDSNNAEYAKLQDVGTAALHIASDLSIHGKNCAIDWSLGDAS